MVINNIMNDQALPSGILNRKTFINALDTIRKDYQGYESSNDQFGPMPSR